jgi:hypothetical protein
MLPIGSVGIVNMIYFKSRYSCVFQKSIKLSFLSPLTLRWRAKPEVMPYTYYYLGFWRIFQVPADLGVELYTIGD